MITRISTSPPFWPNPACVLPPTQRGTAILEPWILWFFVVFPVHVYAPALLQSQPPRDPTFGSPRLDKDVSFLCLKRDLKMMERVCFYLINYTGYNFYVGLVWIFKYDAFCKLYNTFVQQMFYFLICPTYVTVFHTAFHLFQFRLFRE